MKKLYLSVIAMYVVMAHSLGQTGPADSAAYKSKKLQVDEVNLVSSYYTQTADKSSVMGGRPDAKGIGNVTDLATVVDLKLIKYDGRFRKITWDAGIGVDHHTAASQAYVDSNGKAKSDGNRIYPTLDWTIENEKKGTSFGIGGYYSAEHNYYHSLGLNTSYSKKNKRNGEFSLKLTGYFDQITMIKPSEFVPVDSAKSSSGTDSVVYVTSASGQVRTVTYHNGVEVGGSGRISTPTRARDTYTASLGFSQVINQRLTGSLAVDLVYQNGYLGLPFHRVYYNTGKDTIENLPGQRFKLPVAIRLNYFLGDMFILRAYYRFYTDSWGLVSHTANIEIPIKITPFISISPFYRYYIQSAARYFAPYLGHKESDQYFTSNYALAGFSSQSFGTGLRLAPPKGLLIKGLSMLELRYNHYSQTTNLVSNDISVNFRFK